MASRREKEQAQRDGQRDGEWARDHGCGVPELDAFGELCTGPRGYNPPSDPETRPGYDSSYNQGRTGRNP